MRAYLCLSLLPHFFSPQFLHQFKMLMSSLEVVGEDIDEQSQDLSHYISDDESDHDQHYYDIHALYWAFGSDVSVGDGGDDCDAEVHDVDVGLPPAQNESHLVEGPTVVDPAQIGSVGSIVVVVVDPQTHQVEENTHVMGVQHTYYCQLNHQISSTPSDVQLSYSLKLHIDSSHSVKFQYPYQLYPIRLQRSRSQRNYDGNDGQQVNRSLELQVFSQDCWNISDQQSILIEGLERSQETIQNQHEDEQNVKAEDYPQLILPKLLPKSKKKTHFQDIKEHDDHDADVPHQQEEVIRAHHTQPPRVVTSNTIDQFLFGWW